MAARTSFISLPLQLDAGIGGGEPPIRLRVLAVAVVFPCEDFLGQGLLVCDAAIEALGRKYAEFGLRYVQPTAMLWGIVPLEALNQAACLLGWEGLVK